MAIISEYGESVKRSGAVYNRSRNLYKAPAFSGPLQISSLGLSEHESDPTLCKFVYLLCANIHGLFSGFTSFPYEHLKRDGHPVGVLFPSVPSAAYLADSEMPAERERERREPAIRHHRHFSIALRAYYL